MTYSLGSGWNVVDALYFAVATLTTTSVADPDLVLQDGWLKLFTVLYLLVGIGILVESCAAWGWRSWRCGSRSGPNTTRRARARRLPERGNEARRRLSSAPAGQRGLVKAAER